jgi:hypothetical protein
LKSRIRKPANKVITIDNNNGVRSSDLSFRDQKAGKNIVNANSNKRLPME